MRDYFHSGRDGLKPSNLSRKLTVQRAHLLRSQRFFFSTLIALRLDTTERGAVSTVPVREQQGRTKGLFTTRLPMARGQSRLRMHREIAPFTTSVPHSLFHL